MGNLFKSQVVTVNTKDNECKVHISLDLNINLTGNELSISTKAKQEEIEEQPVMEIPTFKSNPKIKFGKKVETKEI